MSDLRAAIQDRIDQPGDVYLETRAYVAAIQAVIDLHEPKPAMRSFGDRRPCCTACDDGRSVPVWPCPTVTLVASAMGIPAGEAS